MQLERSACCVHHGPAHFLKPAPHRVFRSSTLRAARSLSQQLRGRAFAGSNRHCNCLLFSVPAQQSTRKQQQLCQAAQQPDSESFQASSDLPASSPSSASSIPSSQSHIDDSRKASNAAASTSASPANGTGPDESSFRQFLSQPAKAIAAFLQHIVNFLKSFPAYIQSEKLQRLHKKALDDPTNAERSQAYLSELNKRDSAAVIKYVDSGSTAVNSAVIVEYLKALVKTGAIAQFSDGGNVRDGGNHSSLAQLLKDLEKRAEGGAAATEAVGSTISRPLHVVLQDQSTKRATAGGPLSWITSLLITTASFLALAMLCALGAAVIRRYSGGGAGALAGGPAASITGPGGTSYAPKEYNKENMPEKSLKTFKDVKGCPEAKAELEEIVEYLKHPDKFTKLGGKLPKGVLLTGPPGTGKTLLAKAVAGEAGVPFFYRAGSEFEEMFVGVGSRRVRSLFAAAKKKAPCIVFIDEIDAVGGSRKQWENHTRKTLNQLLTEMDGFEANEGVIVMAATNLQETLDPALTRPGRFDRRVAVPMPDVRGRLEILEHYLKDKPRDSTVNAAVLARQTPGFSGAELSNLVNEAALLAAKTSKPKLSAELLDSARDKALMGVERRSLVQSAEARKLTAYHESGHALVAMHSLGADPIHKATIVPRGHALGMVSQVPDKDEFSQSKRQMMARIDVCMGGKVAEEVIFGRDSVTSGARSDLQQATSLARHMVTECGMSDELGPVYLNTDNRGQEATSSDTHRRVDAEVTRMLREAYSRVTTLLTDREADLHTLARALLEHETLTRDEIQQVLDGTFSKVPVAREAAEAEVEGLLAGHVAQDAAQPRH